MSARPVPTLQNKFGVLSQRQPEFRPGFGLRHARITRSLRVLADQVACSESFLPKVGSDQVTPLLDVRHRVAEAPGLTEARLLATASEGRASCCAGESGP